MFVLIWAIATFHWGRLRFVYWRWHSDIALCYQDESVFVFKFSFGSINKAILRASQMIRTLNHPWELNRCVRWRSALWFLYWKLSTWASSISITQSLQTVWTASVCWTRQIWLTFTKIMSNQRDDSLMSQFFCYVMSSSDVLVCNWLILVAHVIRPAFFRMGFANHSQGIATLNK